MCLGQILTDTNTMYDVCSDAVTNLLATFLHHNCFSTWQIQSGTYCEAKWSKILVKHYLIVWQLCVCVLLLFVICNS